MHYTIDRGSISQDMMQTFWKVLWSLMLKNFLENKSVSDHSDWKTSEIILCENEQDIAHV